MFLGFFAVFAVGLMVGVFLNILIYCLPIEMTIPGDAFKCRGCGMQLKGRTFIPFFGYLFLKKSCHCHRAVVPIRYLVVELITGTIFVLLFHRYSLSIEFILFAYLLSILIVVFFIDLDYKIIPDELVVAALVGSAAAFIYNLFQPFGVYEDRVWWNPLAGILPGAGFLMLVAIIGILIYKTDEVMGMGDVKIFIPIGIYLGWRMCVLTTLLSLVAGGVTSLFLIAAGIKKRKDAIPFGPFIVIGTFIAVMWGWDIVRWYFG